MPEYKLTVTGRPDFSWNRYHADVPLEYGNEIEIEGEDASGQPTSLHVRVTSVDNDALFTNHATVEPVDGA